ncbi:MAG: sulfite exporter TauE/SafE family protein, partial [Candidatus Zixiibacteriota bacterium]
SGMGNVDFRLGVFSIIASVIGIELGKRMVLALEKAGNVGEVVRWVYMVFLFGLGSYMVYDYVSAMRRMRQEGGLTSAQVAKEYTSPAAVKLHRINLPPVVSLPTSGIERISFWVVFGIFLCTGFLSGFMGVGGGFILLPALIYLVGCPTTVAVGTSLLSVCFMSGYGTFSYSMSGRTELVAAMIMLIGAAVGAQIGVLATRYVRGYGIRLLFAIMILLAGLSVSLKQAQALFDMPAMGTAAGYCVMGAAGGMTLLIFIRLLMGIFSEKTEMQGG